MIDAAIVRVCKARRVISHNELLAEVTQQVRTEASLCMCMRVRVWMCVCV